MSLNNKPGIPATYSGYSNHVQQVIILEPHAL